MFYNRFKNGAAPILTQPPAFNFAAISRGIAAPPTAPEICPHTPLMPDADFYGPIETPIDAFFVTLEREAEGSQICRNDDRGHTCR